MKNPRRNSFGDNFCTYMVGKEIIPTRCRDLHLKQFCLEDIAPATLIILITHIIMAVLWMLIKILSAVINGQRSHMVIVLGGCYLGINIIRKIDRKITILQQVRCVDLHWM